MTRYMILFALLALPCHAAWDATNTMAAFDPLMNVKAWTTKTIIRECAVSNRHFTVHYTYNPLGPASVPATYPAGQSHYDCAVTVYENGKQVGKSFRGQVTENGCFEDVPADMVTRALGMPIAAATNETPTATNFWQSAATNETPMVATNRAYAETTDDDSLVDQSVRDTPEYRKAMKLFRQSHTNCEYCLIAKDLQVSHNEPLWLSPEKACDTNNYTMLCRNCHLQLAHCRDYAHKAVTNLRAIINMRVVVERKKK